MDSKLDIERDRLAEYKQQQRFMKQDYCNRDCDEHTEQCPYYDPETESWDYEECFRDKGW